MRSRCGARRDQGHEANVAAGADALQHHVAGADRPLDPAVGERFAARGVEASFGKTGEAEQRAGGLAGADEQAVAREGYDRRLDTFHQTLQPLDQRHRPT